jgi:hypothetical protein
MHIIAAEDLLNFWEQNINRTSIQRAIYLLCLAYPDKKISDISGLSIGERDAKLLLLREWIFGPKLLNMADCPVCRERIEWETDIQDIRLQFPGKKETSAKYFLDIDGYNVLFRLPNSNDLSAIISAHDENSRAEKLLKSLIVDCKFNKEPCDFNDLPEKIRTILDQRIEVESPQADIFMSVKCVKCTHEWEIRFDILTYLWSEIDSWARHILHDIDLLARTYGWSEKEILSLSPARRQIYLEMVSS